MKIGGLKAHREGAEAIVNSSFYPTTLDLVHAAKKALALRSVRTEEFLAAAEIEGVTPEELQQTILSKPDDIVGKDNARRRLIVAIRKANSVTEIDKILTSAGLPTRRPAAPGITL
jgi:hypothetical protein